MITALCVSIAVLLLAFFVAYSLYRAECFITDELDTDNRRLGIENLQLTTRVANLHHALDISGDVIDSMRKKIHEDRMELMRKAWLKNHGDDIGQIVRDIENGLRG